MVNDVPKNVNLKGELMVLDSPKVMGILNITPDSFYAKSRVRGEKEILQQAEIMLQNGADFLDVGAYSTRPGAMEVPQEKETQQIKMAMGVLAKEFPQAHLSVDTFRASVAKVALDLGAAMVNDVSGGNLDAEMFDLVAQYQVPYVLMHMQGTPKTMQNQPQYSNVVLEVNQFFSERINALNVKGLNDIILDPGFGFGKTLYHNYQLLNELGDIGFGDYPILVGLSRKSMIYKILNRSPETALNGTTALHMAALERGANILRVHDVKEAKEVVTLFEHIKKPPQIEAV